MKLQFSKLQTVCRTPSTIAGMILLTWVSFAFAGCDANEQPAESSMQEKNASGSQRVFYLGTVSWEHAGQDSFAPPPVAEGILIVWKRSIDRRGEVIDTTVSLDPRPDRPREIVRLEGARVGEQTSARTADGLRHGNAEFRGDAWADNSVEYMLDSSTGTQLELSVQVRDGGQRMQIHRRFTSGTGRHQIISQGELRQVSEEAYSRALHRLLNP